MELMGKAVPNTADAVADSALAIGHCQVQPGSDEDKCARPQLELPMRHGGIGLHRLSRAEGSAAFLSSAALANVAMTGAPEQFRPFDEPSAQASARLTPDFFQHARKCPPLATARSARHKFSVELGARSCSLLGCPPHLSPTARESTQLVTGIVRAIVCLRKEPDIGTDLAEAGQLGVGIPGGADNILSLIHISEPTRPY